MNAIVKTGSSPRSGSLSLGERLRARIIDAGPITFRDWMAAALYDSEEGYYRCSDCERWGREGDYRTSPDRSALFAATFARYFAQLYEESGQPARWTILEAGAGNGRFAEGVLETLQHRFPNVFAATRYVIDEVSQDSQERARARLKRFGGLVEFSDLNDLDPIDPGIVFSNELLDAFPVHRVTLNDGRLCEYYVRVNEAGDFEWTIGPLSTPRLAEYLLLNDVKFVAGQIAEINLGVEDWFQRVVVKLNSGYVVTVDYGAETHALFAAPERRQGTLRGFSRHQIVENVLARPGEQDITTTVDWGSVKRVGQALGLAVITLERQDRFLLGAGLLEELELMVGETQSAADQVRLRTSAREMILPGGMAASFDVLVLRK